jgi:hypothetical protein
MWMRRTVLVTYERRRNETSTGALALLVCVGRDDPNGAWSDGGCLDREKKFSVGLMTPHRDCKREIALTKT